mmetsp:Transcript_97205/g.222711  ORF Transcript_97205/g.222711 Transcript_97205/m.222711 type:complete len:241 (+) Transcript_97205:2515-3237(+)
MPPCCWGLEHDSLLPTVGIIDIHHKALARLVSEHPSHHKRDGIRLYRVHIRALVEPALVMPPHSQPLYSALPNEPPLAETQARPSRVAAHHVPSMHSAPGQRVHVRRVGHGIVEHRHTGDLGWDFGDAVEGVAGDDQTAAKQDGGDRTLDPAYVFVQLLYPPLVSLHPPAVLPQSAQGVLHLRRCHLQRPTLALSNAARSLDSPRVQRCFYLSAGFRLWTVLGRPPRQHARQGASTGRPV